MSEWLLWLGVEGQLATWLVASLLLYTLGVQLVWQYRYPGRTDPLGRWIDRWRDHPLVPWLGEVTRLIYFLGVPLAAAVIGLLRADLIGLTGADWTTGQNIQGFLWEDWARGVGLAAVAVMGGSAAWYAGRVSARRIRSLQEEELVSAPLWRRLLDVFYCQVHWAFYRSGPILWLNDVYWGAFLGLALALLEEGVNPAFWWSVKSTDTAAPHLARLGAAWVSALLFLVTRNLWLTTAAHLALVLLMRPRQAQNV